MYIEDIGERDINISHDLSLRGSLKKIKRIKNLMTNNFNDYSYWSAIYENRFERIIKGV
ncbi:MAG: hypothetical protein SVZ03_01195 [Spirochaetota bacterium]|nr:hypothetical protein [Spirochaetota bacterium]